MDALHPDWGQLLADARAMVECESPSADLVAVARSADLVARITPENRHPETDTLLH